MPKKILERFRRIDYLIQKRGTGKPNELSQRIEVSESTLYEYLAIMKSFGAPIAFDKERNTYYYSEKGKFKIFFEKNNDSDYIGV